MVDLAFLLITFFMLTTTLSKPKAMDMAMPDTTKRDEQLPVPASRTMTVLLGSNNKVEWYIGETGKSAPTVDHFGRDGLRKALIENSDRIKASHSGQPMIVLVKPSDKSTYKDFVSALDELNITGIDEHAVVKITQPEIDDLKKNGLYQ
jgi:biopolymer transport protein ExbD